MEQDAKQEMLPSSAPTCLPNRSPADGTIQDDRRSGDQVGATPSPYRLPTYDLIVVGGGINGAGIARDAALRGLKVLLLEKNDFGSGTSAYSSRLIHGGLRYLANLELDLVYESLSERELLLKNAPHLVHPLALGIPVYQGGQNSALVIELGMLLYDLLSIRKSLPWHRAYGKKGFLGRYPQVNTDGLCGGPVYYDAQVDFPELICVENAIAARETGNASILNHACVTGLMNDKGRISGVYFKDTLTGKNYVAPGKVVINAVGPWLDSVIHLAAGNGKNAPLLRLGGTKGSHIVVRRFAEGPETALYVEAQSDSRPFFIIPWREDFYLIGTTDIRFEGDPDQVAAQRDEVEYLLAETNRVLPHAKLTVEDVLYTYSGVRPLPVSNGARAGKISRKHWIEDHAKDKRHPLPGLISVIGGKLTTYRNLAEAVVDYAISAYQLRLPGDELISESQTRFQPLPGGEGIADIAAYKLNRVKPASQRYELPESLVSHLIDLYGGRFERVLVLTEENPGWKRLLGEGSHDILAQVVYAVREQMALTVTDVMLRRIGCGLDVDSGFGKLETVARCMGNELRWDEGKIQAEMADYRYFIEKRHFAFREKQKTT